MALSEFEIIDRFFAARATGRTDVALGIGDDAAVLNVSPGMQLVVAVDGLIEGVHFPVGTDPAAVGHKALAVNLSDLAAMGAEPAWATLYLSLPDPDPARAKAFADGFLSLADRYGMALVGGDTVRGPFTVAVQVMGLVPQGGALSRGGARPGDGIYVTGSLGDGGAGLALVQGRLTASGDAADRLRRRLDWPEPRVGIGVALRGIASAAIDISDGLVADLGHILERSGIGARVEVEQLPFSAELRQVLPDEAARTALALHAGDDYELCFTVPAEREPMLKALDSENVQITRIGTIEAQPGVRLVRVDGTPFNGRTAGYDHFAGGSHE